MADNDLGREPGVRVKEEPNANLGITSPQFRVCGLTGTSFTEILVRDIAVVRGSGTTDTIPGYDADEITEILTISSYMEAYGTQRTKYESGTDYTVAGNVITWDQNGPLEGSTYYVTANITKLSESFFTPKEFTDYSQVTSYYGPEYDSDADTINELVVLARFMFAAGARRVVTCQAKTNALSDLQAAIDQYEELNIQYLLSGSNTVAGLNEAILRHVVDMNTVEVSMPRQAFVAPTNINGTLQDIITEARSLAEQHITMVGPQQVLIQVQDQYGNSHRKWVSSIYASAAIVGMLANPNRRLATPLTRKALTSYGILDISQYYKSPEVVALSGKGVTVLKKNKETNVIFVNQGVTTDISNWANYYLNVVCEKMEVARILQRELDEKYIGGEIDDPTPTDVKSFITRRLNDLKGNLIRGFQNVTVAEDAVNPAKLNVYLEIYPIFGLDYIDLTFKVVRQGQQG